VSDGLSPGDRAWLRAFFNDISHRFDKLEAAVGENTNTLATLVVEVDKLRTETGEVLGKLVEHAARQGHRDDRAEETIGTLVLREQSASR
jgi:hypothetical protein